MRSFRCVLRVIPFFFMGCGDSPVAPEEMEYNPLLEMRCMEAFESNPLIVRDSDGKIIYNGVVDLKVSWKFHEDGSWEFSRTTLHAILSIPEDQTAIETHGFYAPDHLSSNVWVYLLQRLGGSVFDPQSGSITEIPKGNPSLATFYLQGDGKIFLDDVVYTPCGG